MISYSALSDLELVSLLTKGDRQAFTEIYDRYALLLLGHAFNKTRDRELAKDMVQEVFSALWAKREQLHVNSNLSGFLYTSVRNSVLNQIAHTDVQDRYIDFMIRFAAESQAETDHLVREKQMNELIQKEVAALSPQMRRVFEMSRKEHLSHREIANKLDLSEQTVSKHLTNALKVLRVKFGIFAFLLFILPLL